MTHTSNRGAAWRRLSAAWLLLSTMALLVVACAPEKKQEWTPPPDETAKVGDPLPEMTFATCDGSKSYQTKDLAESGAKLLLLTGHSMW